MAYRFLYSLFSLLMLSSCERVNEPHSSVEESDIKTSSQAYEKAYNQHDSKSLSTLWSEDATYVNPESGDIFEGREAIQQEFERIFGQQNPHLEIQIDTITFPKPDQAIETGTLTVKRDGVDTQTSAYKAFLEKTNGKWFLKQVRTIDVAKAPSQHEHLKELDWFIGHWDDKDEDVEIKSENQWDKYQNFITQKFTMSTEGLFQLDGRQIIGWDPLKKEIRSWLFDSDGGFGEGTWKKKDNNWVVEMIYTLADGTKGSAIQIYTPLDANSYSWQSTGREIGGELLPDIEPVKVIRVKSEEKK